MGILSKFRNVLYTSAKTLGDLHAVTKGNVVTRVKNRINGKIAGKFIRKL